MKRILAVGLSATLQKTILFPELSLDAVNRSEGYRLDASGKAVNAARVLNQLEAGCVTSVCPLGSQNADLFLELADKDKLDIAYLLVPGRTRYCYTLVDPKSGTTTELVVSEPLDTRTDTKAAYQKAETALLSLISGQLDKTDALLFAGSKPAAWSRAFPARICTFAKEQGKIVMADFHGTDLLDCLESCTPDIIKINEQEFCSTFGYTFPLNKQKLNEVLCQKSRELANIIIITRGSAATVAAIRGNSIVQPVQAVQALNATGCGDSFSAGFLYEWLKKQDIQAALEKGSWCAMRNALNFRPGSVREPNNEGESTW